MRGFFSVFNKMFVNVPSSHGTSPAQKNLLLRVCCYQFNNTVNMLIIVLCINQVVLRGVSRTSTMKIFMRK